MSDGRTERKGVPRLWRLGLNPLPREPLPPGQITMLALLGATIALGRYDLDLLALVIPFVQRDLGIAEESVGAVFGIARLGVVPGVLLGLFADRLGRARLLLFTIVGFSLATAATGLAQTPAAFVAAQFIARFLIETEVTLATVIIIEELTARNRGWGLGFVAGLGTLGAGLSAVLYAMIEELPGGWRSLYFASLAAILTLAWLRRNLSETRRFAAQAEDLPPGRGLADLLLPLRGLFRAYPGRLIGLSLARVPFTFGVAAGFALQAKHLIETQGFTPGHITLLYIGGGAVAILGNLIGGTLSDRFGRKPVLAATVLLTGLGMFGFYQLDGVAMIACWILYTFANFAALVIFSAFDAELFPTSHRATASSFGNVMHTLGYSAGTLSEGVLFGLLGSHAAAVSLMTGTAAGALLAIAAFIPETANRPLEAISPERGG